MNTMPKPVVAGWLATLTAVHQAEGFRLQDRAAARGLAAFTVDMRHHEARHVEPVVVMPPAGA